MIGSLKGLPGKVKAVYDYLTTNLAAARAAKIDNLDAAISSRAAAGTALSTATWTVEKAGFIDGAISGRLGSIKSLQYVTVALAYNESSKAATIAAVATAKSVMIPMGGYASGAPTDQIDVLLAMHGQWTLTNSTTVTLNGTTYNSSPAGTRYFKVLVVEFN